MIYFNCNIFQTCSFSTIKLQHYIILGYHNYFGCSFWWIQQKKTITAFLAQEWSSTRQIVTFYSFSFLLWPEILFPHFKFTVDTVVLSIIPHKTSFEFGVLTVIYVKDNMGPVAMPVPAKPYWPDIVQLKGSGPSICSRQSQLIYAIDGLNVIVWRLVDCHIGWWWVLAQFFCTKAHAHFGLWLVHIVYVCDLTLKRENNCRGGTGGSLGYDGRTPWTEQSFLLHQSHIGQRLIHIKVSVLSFCSRQNQSDSCSIDGLKVVVWRLVDCHIWWWYVPAQLFCTRPHAHFGLWLVHVFYVCNLALERANEFRGGAGGSLCYDGRTPVGRVVNSGASHSIKTF